MRERVIGRVASGASRREAAEQFEVSASTAIIWVKCFDQTGRCAAKPRGGSASRLEGHADCLLALIEEQPDLTVIATPSSKHREPTTFPFQHPDWAIMALTGQPISSVAISTVIEATTCAYANYSGHSVLAGDAGNS